MRSTSSRSDRAERRRRAQRIGAQLDAWMPSPPIPLHHQTPFQLLVAVVLSAQCTDDRVNQVTPALFARAPNATAMARLSADQILPLIASCGLAPTKAKHLAALARDVVRSGAVPHQREQLMALPGVGRKTANVVLSQAFGEPAMPVDTHILRLAARWGLSAARTPDQVERDLCDVFPQATWSRRHLQMIYFGRAFCTARGHDITRCPICIWAAPKAPSPKRASVARGQRKRSQRAK